MQRVWTSNLPIVRMDVQRAVADDEEKKSERIGNGEGKDE